MIDLIQLESFRAVVTLKSFSRAAVSLGYSQSSVTTHVKGLERELGTPLIERHRFSRTLFLTEAGRRVFDCAEKMLALAEETKAAARRGATADSIAGAA